MSCTKCHQHVCSCEATAQFNTNEVKYTGDNITCGNDLVVRKNESLTQTFIRLVSYICANIKMKSTGFINNVKVYQIGTPTNVAIESLTVWLNGLTADGLSNMIDLTYAQLLVHINNSTLKPSQIYRITDYQTIYDQPDYSAVDVPKVSITTKTATIEPLVVMATSINTLAREVYSPLFPKDMLHYEAVYTLPVNTATPTKGRITYRKDTEKNNECNWDFRTILFKRYNDASGDPMITYDNGNPSAEFLTFVSYPDTTNNSIINDSGVDLRFNDNIVSSLDLPNIVFHSDIQDTIVKATIRDTTVAGSCINLQIKYRSVNFLLKGSYVNDCLFENVMNASLLHGGGMASTNVLDAFQDCTIVASSISNNNITLWTGCTLNFSQMNNNEIRDFKDCTASGSTYFNKNNISGWLRNTSFNGDFVDNRMNSVSTVSFGSAYSNNINIIFQSTIGAGLYGSILNSIVYSTIGTNFGRNSSNDGYPNIGTDIANCTIGNNMHANQINTPITDLIISNDFRQNTINATILTLDLTTATHVYQPYHCDIIENTGATSKLRYVDQYEAIVTVDITD